jgi:hypothetical protein
MEKAAGSKLELMLFWISLLLCAWERQFCFFCLSFQHRYSAFSSASLPFPARPLNVYFTCYVASQKFQAEFMPPPGWLQLLG